MDLLKDLKSENVDDHSNIASNVFVIGIIIVYIIFVYQIGPRLMKNREAFQLKHLMSIYNITQVASCFYLINRIWTLTSWDLFKHFECISYSPNTVNRATFDSITSFTFWLKVVELTDTVIFVLRKKTNQITYLHVFHHSSTITLIHLLLKYYKGIGALYPIYLNSWVHVIMYSYYFFANICSAEVMKKFILFKKSITIIQMIQFCMILLHAGIMFTYCQIPLILRIYYCLVVSVIFYGFYDFYKKAYSTNNSSVKVK